MERLTGCLRMVYQTIHKSKLPNSRKSAQISGRY